MSLAALVTEQPALSSLIPSSTLTRRYNCQTSYSAFDPIPTASSQRESKMASPDQIRPRSGHVHCGTLVNDNKEDEDLWRNSERAATHPINVGDRTSGHETGMSHDYATRLITNASDPGSTDRFDTDFSPFSPRPEKRLVHTLPSVASPSDHCESEHRHLGLESCGQQHVCQRHCQACKQALSQFGNFERLNQPGDCRLLLTAQQNPDEISGNVHEYISQEPVSRPKTQPRQHRPNRIAVDLHQLRASLKSLDESGWMALITALIHSADPAGGITRRQHRGPVGSQHGLRIHMAPHDGDSDTQTLRIGARMRRQKQKSSKPVATLSSTMEPVESNSVVLDSRGVAGRTTGRAGFMNIAKGCELSVERRRICPGYSQNCVRGSKPLEEVEIHVPTRKHNTETLQKFRAKTKRNENDGCIEEQKKNAERPVDWMEEIGRTGAHNGACNQPEHGKGDSQSRDFVLIHQQSENNKVISPRHYGRQSTPLSAKKASSEEAEGELTEKGKNHEESQGPKGCQPCPVGFPLSARGLPAISGGNQIQNAPQALSQVEVADTICRRMKSCVLLKDEVPYQGHHGNSPIAETAGASIKTHKEGVNVRHIHWSQPEQQGQLRAIEQLTQRCEHQQCQHLEQTHRYIHRYHCHHNHTLPKEQKPPQPEKNLQDNRRSRRDRHPQTHCVNYHHHHHRLLIKRQQSQNGRCPLHIEGLGDRQDQALPEDKLFTALLTSANLN
ncbi:unnamed protein product [Protopolystoma xenopodis]|uniref:Uncharacterized protein n=1 Tax=Protopolystoma xenopodis TaxID=117903 RepID=A0A3S5CFU4_9PLAT|nr:unnamed protein product [Protopolystoma xenopodis]